MSHESPNSSDVTQPLPTCSAREWESLVVRQPFILKDDSDSDVQLESVTSSLEAAQSLSTSYDGSECNLGKKREEFVLKNDHGQIVKFESSSESEDIDAISPSLITDGGLDMQWNYCEEEDKIVDVKIKKEEVKESQNVPVKKTRVIITQSQLAFLPVGTFKVEPEAELQDEILSLDNKPKKWRKRISSCSICFEDEDRMHQCEEAKLILLCMVHNTFNCCLYQVMIYIPPHGYICLIEINSENSMAFLVKCFHALTERFLLELKYTSYKSQFYGAPTGIKCNSKGESLAVPKEHYLFIKKIKTFFILYLQRMIKSVVFTHNEDDIEFKRFAFYHNLSASKVTVDESVTDYDTVHAAEITFMKCEYMLCAINLF